ncbi:MAG: hypothetical protein K6F27_10935 [Ruminococcus sp.]|nr:hypothetical protein [Ruminococcus sp.]
MKAKMAYDNGKLIIETEKNKYEFKSDEFIELETGGFLLRKAGISRITAQEEIIIGKPEPMPNERFVTANRIVVLVSATKDNETVWEIGSASPETLKGFANLYPFEMAYNRARQRAVLCLLGLGGKVYGEDEIQEPIKKPVNDPNTRRPVIITDGDEATNEIPRYQVPELSKVYGMSEQTQPYRQPQAPQQLYNVQQGYIAPSQTTSASGAPQPPQRAGFVVRPEHQSMYPWLTQEAADLASTIDPNTYVLDQGKNKAMGWTAAQTLAKDPQTVEWYAEKNLGANQRFNEAVLACRAAIIQQFIA